MRTASALRRVGRSIAYWSSATVVVVGLMASIFFAALTVHNHWFPVHLALAPMFVLIGLALIVIGIRSPATLGALILGGLKGGLRQPAIPLIQIRAVLIGFGFLGGGLLYGLTADVDAIIYSFAVSVALMLCLSIMAGLRREC